MSLKKNNTTYIVHDNLRGDVEVITDTSGNIVAQAHYDPWGNQVAASGSLVQPMRYAGYYYDDETGLYYLKSRYYSPALGRFLIRDDIGYINHSNPQTLNLYSYCGNNPVSLTDPDGKWASKAEQDLAYIIMDPDDYNKMCDLGFDWETGDRGQIEADANNIRAKYGLPAFGSNSKRVIVQESESWTAKIYWPDFFFEGKDFKEPEVIGKPYSGGQAEVSNYQVQKVYNWVPVNYTRTGTREDRNRDWDWSRGIEVHIVVSVVTHYDYGPRKR